MTGREITWDSFCFTMWTAPRKTSVWSVKFVIQFDNRNRNEFGPF